MSQPHTVIPRRQVMEWAFTTHRVYQNPFIDVTLDVTFAGPAGQSFQAPAFYAGHNTWKVRFNPGDAGSWSFRSRSIPPDPELDQTGAFDVEASDRRGFLRATPGQGWGFSYESGEPALIFGDTVYNLFGMAYCGGDVNAFLERRARQGFNLLRVRVPVSPYHPPAGYSAWQNRRTWPWGGSEQAPDFSRFNLDYFETVDTVVAQVESLGMGLEMIMEAWGFEFPFNSRNLFVAEWEELWLRYLIARYDAYNCLYFWTPLNEYEFYPNGDWHYKQVADLWAMRIARWIKRLGQHGHIVSVHNGPREPAFAQRFAADPGAIDAIMYQCWGTNGEQDGWLAAGIDEGINLSLKGWPGSAVLAEWGYERNPEFELLVPGHQYSDPEHTRRGAWRGAFSGLGIIHGFENSWGPWMRLDQDQPGMAYLQHLRRFFTEIVPFAHLLPAPDLIQPADRMPGYAPLALATASRNLIAIYFPAGGQAGLNLPPGATYRLDQFDPRTGQVESALATVSGAGVTVGVPPRQDAAGRSDDFVLVLRAAPVPE